MMVLISLTYQILIYFLSYIKLTFQYPPLLSCGNMAYTCRVTSDHLRFLSRGGAVTNKRYKHVIINQRNEIP